VTDLAAVAARLAAAFGDTGPSTLGRYPSPDSDHAVDVATWSDRPGPGLTSFATIGMSRFDNGTTTPTGALRVELVTAVQHRWELMTDVLCELAFAVARGETYVQPGRVFTSVPHLRTQTTTPNVLFWDPFLWQLPSLPLEGTTVAWLMVVPISEAEARLAAEHGAEALIDEFERLTPDIHDLSRPSAV
jgi:antitoxin YqcF